MLSSRCETSRCRGSAASPANGRGASAARTPSRAGLRRAGSTARTRCLPPRTPRSTSSEMRRPRLYWFCTETIVATDCAARSCSSETFETPDQPDLPLLAQLARARRPTPRSAPPGRGGAAGRGRCARASAGAGSRRTPARRYSGRPSRMRSCRAVAEPAFRCDHEAVRVGMERLRDDLLARARRRRCRRCRSASRRARPRGAGRGRPPSRSSTMRIAPKPSLRTSSSPPSRNVGFTRGSIGFAR